MCGGIVFTVKIGQCQRRVQLPEKESGASGITVNSEGRIAVAHKDFGQVLFSKTT